VARLRGLEPLTYGLEVRCSIQLSYRRPKEHFAAEVILQQPSGYVKRKVPPRDITALPQGGKGREVRMMLRHGEPWFAAADACGRLMRADAGRSHRRHGNDVVVSPAPDRSVAAAPKAPKAPKGLRRTALLPHSGARGVEPRPKAPEGSAASFESSRMM